MAKVKLTLDKRKNSRKKDGTYPIVIVLSHKSKTRTITLNYSVTPKNWNASNLEIKNVANHSHKTAKIQTQLRKAELYILQHKLEIKSMPINELKTCLQAEILSSDNTTDKDRSGFIKRSINKESIVEYGQQKIARLRNSKKNGYAKAINTGLSSLLRFSSRDDLLFTEIDLPFLKNFVAYCVGRGNKPNTISAYLRPIKTLFREAIQEGIIPPDLNPFPKFKIPKAKNTKKRALRLEDINAIRQLDLKEGSAHWDARNYFLFMFNNMGINLIDVAKLKKKQIIGAKFKKGILVSGRLNYTRSKNGRQYSIKLTQESMDILNSYQINEKKDDELIFPIGFEDSEAGFSRYTTQRKRINRRIRDLGKKVGIKENISSYYARHSWATIAKRKMIPVSVIAEGLGHSDLKTTQIYLDSFDDDTLDSANDEIVG